MNARRWFNVLRRLVLAVILILVGRYAWQHLAGLRDLGIAFTPGLLVVTGISALAWMLIQSLLWRVVLRVVGADTDLRRAFAQIWLSNLGKYVPGKVWAAVGRVYTCTLAGIPIRQGSVALLLENVSFILGAAVLAMVTLSASALGGTAGEAGDFLAPVLIAVAGGLVVVHPKVWGSAVRVVLGRLGREPVEVRVTYARSLLLVLAYLGSWAVLGAGVHAWSSAVVPLSFGLGLRVVGLYVVAWAVGYVSMLAPAGIGVREGIMMAGLAGTIGPESAVAVALGLRVYLTLIDLVAAALAVAAAPDVARRLAGADASSLGA